MALAKEEASEDDDEPLDVAERCQDLALCCTECQDNGTSELSKALGRDQAETSPEALWREALAEQRGAVQRQAGRGDAECWAVRGLHSRGREPLGLWPRNHLHPGAPDGSCCGRVASAKHQCQRFWPARRVILWKSTHQAITPGSAIALEFWETVVHENAPFIRNYSLSHGWEVTNNNQLLELQGSQSNASYRLLQAGDSPLLSQSGRFGLAFFRFHNSAEFYFALVLGSSNNTNSGVCVWAANRDSPVTENATVRVTDQGALEVADWDGK
ncbi:hypothetical protein SELMODRAFT_430337, partial [Selaginella moellendorffii]